MAPLKLSNLRYPRYRHLQATGIIRSTAIDEEPVVEWSHPRRKGKGGACWARP